MYGCIIITIYPIYAYYTTNYLDFSGPFRIIHYYHVNTLTEYVFLPLYQYMCISMYFFLAVAIYAMYVMMCSYYQIKQDLEIYFKYIYTSPVIFFNL